MKKLVFALSLILLLTSCTNEELLNISSKNIKSANLTIDVGSSKADIKRIYEDEEFSMISEFLNSLDLNKLEVSSDELNYQDVLNIETKTSEYKIGISENLIEIEGVQYEIDLTYYEELFAYNNVIGIENVNEKIELPFFEATVVEKIEGTELVLASFSSVGYGGEALVIIPIDDQKFKNGDKLLVYHSDLFLESHPLQLGAVYRITKID